jgi:sodium transport system permease protein
MNHPFSVIFWKEVRENLRDKRTITSALLMGPVFGPVLFAVMFSVMIQHQKSRSEAPLELPVIGAENASSFIRFARQQGAKILPGPADPEQAIRDKQHDLVLRIEDDYAEQFRSGLPARLQLYYDASNKDSSTPVQRTRQLVQRYSRTIGSLRLQVRGVNPVLGRAAFVEDHDLSTPQSRAAVILALLPYVLMIGIFTGGMYLAIDTTAGEKERQSLEPLLLNPVHRSTILAGKLAATVTFSLLAVAITIVTFKIAFAFIPFEELGMQLKLDARTMGLIFLLLVPVALLAGALQTIIAAFSRNFREAQTYLSLLLLLPMLPSIAVMVMPIKEKAWMMATPILGQNLLINQLVKGEAIKTVHLALALGGTLALGLVLAWVAVKLYNRERMLFSQ